MSHDKIKTGASCALAVLAMLLVTAVAVAQGSVTPSYGDGKLTLTGEGYQPGERVEITVRVGGSSQQFSVRADGRGRFRLETGLQIAPMSRVEVEARDEHGLIQVTTTSGPGTAPASEGGMPLPPLPTELPRTGEAPDLSAGLAGLAVILIAAGLALWRSPRRGHQQQGGD